MADINSILQSILPLTSKVNSVTNLHDDQIAALKGILSKADKSHAQEFINQVGSEKARQLADAHDATAIANSNSTDSNAQDPLIKAAQQGQTQLPTESVDNPAPRSNAKTGNFEYDVPANAIERTFGSPQVFVDSSGVTHFKPGGGFATSQKENALALENAQRLMSLQGKDSVQPQNSIAYQTEQAIQQAKKVPMTQAQKKEYDLQVQGKAAELSKGIADQTMTAITPLTNNLQKIDSLMPLFDNALSSDVVTSKTAISQLVPLLKELSGDKVNGNILNQSFFEKILTGVSGRVGADLITKAKANVQALRSSLINRVGNIQNSAASRIGSFKIGDQVVNGNQLLNHAYFNEAGRNINTFKTEAEAKKAGLVDGTPITVDGKPAFWRN